MADIRTTGLLDDFIRANETPLSGGGNWSFTDAGFLPAMVLASNAATHPSPGTSGDSYWTTLFTPVGSQEVEVWGYPEGGDASGIAWALDLWQQPGGTGVVDGYRFRDEVTGGGSTFILYRVDNAGTTPIGSTSAGFSGASGPYVMLLRRNGGDVEGWFSSDNGANWTLAASATDSAYTGAFYVGAGIRDNSGSQILAWQGIGGGSPSRRHTRIIRYIRN